MKIEVTKTECHLFKCLRFITKAVAKSEARFAIQQVKVERNRFIATDGKRLHIVEYLHDFELGLYEIMKSNMQKVVLLKTEKLAFPKYEDTIPQHKNYFEIVSSHSDVTTGMKAAFGLAQKGSIFRPDYLADALGNDEDWKIYFGEFDQAILCVNGCKRAVIMPINPPRIKFHDI